MSHVNSFVLNCYPPPVAASGATEHVVVTATPGVPQEAGSTSQAVNVVDEEELALRAKTGLAHTLGGNTATVLVSLFGRG